MSTVKAQVRPLFADLRKSFVDTRDILLEKRVLFKPFIVFACVELAALLLLYLFPRAPFRSLFGPFVSTFWGEAFLHYPSNFLLLAKLASFSRMALSVVVGSVTTAMAVEMVSLAHQDKTIKPKAIFRQVFKKYFHLFLIVFIFTFGFYFLANFIKTGIARYFLSGHAKLLFIGPRLWFGPVLLVLNFLLAVIIQSLFIYAIPALVIDKKRSIPAIINSFMLFKKMFISTIILITVGMVVYLPVMFLIYNSAFLMDRLFPEVVLWVLILGTLISSLVADPLITITATFLYLRAKEHKSK